MATAGPRRCVETPGPEASDPLNGPPIVIEEITDTTGLRACEAIQAEAWGYGALETVPASQFKAVQAAAGMVLGAYRGDQVLGFAYGFLARDTDRIRRADPGDPDPGALGLHSHMVAVRPGWQGKGIGRLLKWAQRDWCLERGLNWMHWTFDPIQAKNARLNMHHLGGWCRRYFVDFYGVIGGDLSGEQATDRLLVEWDLLDPGVAARARAFKEGASVRDGVPSGRDVAPPSGSAPLLGTTEDGSPRPGRLPQGVAALAEKGRAVRLTVDVPRDATRLLRERPAQADAWRLAVRDAMLGALEQGYVVRGFETGTYLLEPPAADTKD